jgi:hypothetical protein
MTGRRLVALIFAVSALAVGGFVFFSRGLPAPLRIAPLRAPEDSRNH